VADSLILPDDVYETAAVVSYAVWKKYRRIISHDDLQQEALLWATRRADDLLRAYGLEDEEEQRRALRRLYWQMQRHCEQQARKEKARQAGYHTSDEAFYDTGTIAHLLPFAIASVVSDAPLEAVQDVVPDGTPRKPASPSEGGTLLVMLLDIKTAFLALDADDRRLLTARYHEERTLKQIAEVENCSISTADRRCERAVKHIQVLLGGKSPWQ
jgi:RNA polymerase sigma factor (sigma-70 family)